MKHHTIILCALYYVASEQKVSIKNKPLHCNSVEAFILLFKCSYDSKYDGSSLPRIALCFNA